jgi:hypothetical protein
LAVAVAALQQRYGGSGIFVLSEGIATQNWVSRRRLF